MRIPYDEPFYESREREHAELVIAVSLTDAHRTRGPRAAMLSFHDLHEPNALETLLTVLRLVSTTQVHRRYERVIVIGGPDADVQPVLGQIRAAFPEIIADARVSSVTASSDDEDVTSAVSRAEVVRA